MCRPKKNIIQIIGKFVKLKKSKGRFIGSCPFHQSLSQTFIVDPCNQVFKCLGCGLTGDANYFLINMIDKTSIELSKLLEEIDRDLLIKPTSMEGE